MKESVSLVGEEEYQYGADAFEAIYSSMNQLEISEIEIPMLQKTGNSR